MRRVKTASGATAVQIVHKRGRRVLSIEHIGSAHTDDELAVLLQVVAAGVEATRIAQAAAPIALRRGGFDEGGDGAVGHVELQLWAATIPQVCVADMPVGGTGEGV